MKWLRLLIISNPSRGGGYKVNITQSEHQTITVSQSSSTNKTTGFTIEDYPTIDISLKADPGYTAGVLNHTSFTFSNDVREVDILATDASYAQDVTYNGNMNVFLCDAASTDRKVFCISNRPSSEFGKLISSDIIQKSEFGLIYDNYFDGYSSAGINNTNNFYNLSSNATYKISNLKIGDTTLTDDELLANFENKITSNDIKWIALTNWFNKVYLQCTGVDLNTKTVESALKPTPSALRQNHPDYDYGANLGGFVFDYSFNGEDTPIGGFQHLYYKKQEDYSNFTEDMKKQIETNITLLKKFFTIVVVPMHSIVNSDQKAFNLKDISVLEEYFSTLKTLNNKFKDNQDALKILSKYTDFAASQDLQPTNITLYKTFNIDKDNICGLADALSCGLPQIYYCMITLAFCMAFSGVETVDTPIISTIPVSITFSNITI